MNSVAVAAAMTVGMCVSAHASGLGVEANAARSYGLWGGELGLGYRAKFGIFDITPAAGAFLYKGDSEYFTTRDSNGTEHCRAPNGQFASKSDCNNLAAKAYARLEAGVSIPAFARLAVGGRYIGSQLRPYGSVGFSVGPKLAIEANGGQHYAAAGLTFGF